MLISFCIKIYKCELLMLDILWRLVCRFNSSFKTKYSSFEYVFRLVLKTYS